MKSITLLFLPLLLAVTALSFCDATDSILKNKLTTAVNKKYPDLTLGDKILCKSKITIVFKNNCSIQVVSPNINGVQICNISFTVNPNKGRLPLNVLNSCTNLTRNNKEDDCDACVNKPVPPRDELIEILEEETPDLTLVNEINCTVKYDKGLQYGCNIQVKSSEIDEVQNCSITYIKAIIGKPKRIIVKNTCLSHARNKSLRVVCDGCEKFPYNTGNILNTILRKKNSDLTMVYDAQCSAKVENGLYHTCMVQVTSPKITGEKICTISMTENLTLELEPKIVKKSCKKFSKRPRNKKQ